MIFLNSHEETLSSSFDEVRKEPIFLDALQSESSAFDSSQFDSMSNDFGDMVFSSDESFDTNRQKADALAVYISRIVEQGKIKEAREILTQFNNIHSFEIDGWKKALRPPVAKNVKMIKSDHNYDASFEWLDKNSERFPGLWVAVKDGNLVASHENRKELDAILEKCKIFPVLVVRL